MNENGRNGAKNLTILILLILAFSLLAKLVFSLCFADFHLSKYTDPIITENIIRGNIIDRSGKLLAIEAPDYGFEVFSDVRSPASAAALLAPYTKYSAAEIESLLYKGELFIPVFEVPDAAKMTEISNYLKKNGLSDQIRITFIEKRKLIGFPSLERILGSVDKDMHGTSGLEKMLDSLLMPEPILGWKTLRGNNARLTIDTMLQEKLDTILFSFPDVRKVILFNSEEEILALHGFDDRIEEMNLLYSTITPQGNETIVFQNTAPHSAERELLANSIYVYVDCDEKDKAALLDALKSLCY